MNTFNINNAIKTLKSTIPVHHICLSDVSDNHTATPAAIKSTKSLNKAGKEYIIMVISNHFINMKTLSRHRLVQSFFQQGFDSSEVHSMRLKTWTIQQWEKKGSPKSVRVDVPCGIEDDDKTIIDTTQESNQTHPITATKRLLFSWWNENNTNHLQLASQLWSDANVTSLIGGPFNEIQVSKKLEKECQSQITAGFQYWPIFCNTSTTSTTPTTSKAIPFTSDMKNFVGVCGLQRSKFATELAARQMYLARLHPKLPHDSNSTTTCKTTSSSSTTTSNHLTNVVEIGFHLIPQHWRQGYAVEAATAVLKYAFHVLKVDAVFAGHHPSNTASAATMHKLGFLPIGELFYPLTGLMHPSYIMLQFPTSKDSTTKRSSTGTGRIESAKETKNENENKNVEIENVTTIIGFGSLMSETSARTTFPNLIHFRLARVTGYRRIFRHPASIFFERGIANLATLEMSSLCAEPAAALQDTDIGFDVVVFDLLNPTTKEMNDFEKREEEFNIIQCPFIDEYNTTGSGLLCTAGSDKAFQKKWGMKLFNTKYVKHGLDTIWNWSSTSGILPCAVYLRHCILATEKEHFPKRLKDSFLDETYLADRKTTIREYIKNNPQIMNSKPPPSLVGRYSG